MTADQLTVKDFALTVNLFKRASLRAVFKARLCKIQIWTIPILTLLIHECDFGFNWTHPTLSIHPSIHPSIHVCPGLHEDRLNPEELHQCLQDTWRNLENMAFQINWCYLVLKC